MEIPSPIYITIAELKLFIPDLSGKNDSEILLLIFNAENSIDKKVGNFGEKEDSAQKRVFPTTQDGLPVEIQLATSYTAKAMYEESIKDETSVLEEKHGTSTYKYGKTGKDIGCTQQISDLLENFTSSNWLR